MNLLISILIGIFAGPLTNYFLAYFGLPSPLPVLGGIVVFLLVVSGRDRINL